MCAKSSTDTQQRRSQRAKRCALLAVGPVRATAIPSPLDLREYETDAIAAFRAAKAKNPSLFDGAIYHLLAWHVERGHIRIEGCFVRFRHALASRSMPRLKLRIRAVGVSGLTLLTHRHNKFVVIARRAPHMTTYPGTYECVPAGVLDAASKTSGGGISLTRAIRTELREELGVRGKHITRIVPFCFVQDACDWSFDIGCCIEIEMSPADLQKTWETTDREYTELQLVPLAHAHRWMTRHRNQLVPAGAVLLDTYLRWQK